MTFEPAGRRVILLGNDPADAQWSMLQYGEYLQRGLQAASGRRLEILLRSPDTRWIGSGIRSGRIGRAAGMYASRHFFYPLMIRKKEACLHHVLDQGNASLMRWLDPEKTIVTCHDLIPMVLESWKKSLSPSLSRWALDRESDGLRRARRLIAVSECTKRDLVARLGYPAERIDVIPLGLDPRLRPSVSAEELRQTRRRFQLPEGPLLLHVGQNAGYKNIEGVLLALAVLVQRKEPVHLVRVGPALTPAQRRLARKTGIQDRILEKTGLEKEDLFALYRAADLLVYPSWYEGFGLPPLEAMASGLPVVASDRGALPETVAEAGILFPADRPDETAGGIQRMLHDSSLREEMRRRGLERAGRFRWEETAARTLRVYRPFLDDILGSNPETS